MGKGNVRPVLAVCLRYWTFFVGVALLLGGALPLAAAPVVGADSAPAVSNTQADETAVSGTGSPSIVKAITLPSRSRTIPSLTQDQRDKLNAATERSNHPVLPAPQDPNAILRPGPPQAPAAVQPYPADGRAADTDFVAFRNNALNIAGQGGSTSTTDEPSVSSNGNTIFYTGNWYAAVSTDSGASFSYLSPYTDFPSVYGGFCCDQVTIYDPSRNITIWELQYLTDGSNNNVQRFAIANGQAGVASNAWRYFDIAAPQLGFPSGSELDYPHLVLGTNYLYATTNVFNGAGSGIGTVISRLSLDALATTPQSGSITPVYNANTTGSYTYTPVSGAGTTMYYARHASNTILRLFSWPESSLTATFVDVAHSAYPGAGGGSHHCVSPDSFDMCARDDERLKTGWVAGGMIGFMWDAAQGTGGLGTFAYPYIHAVRINAATNALIDEPIIYSAATAYAFPGVGINERGAIGGSVAFGGGGNYPSSSIFIRDDISPSAWQFLITRTGTNGPARNRWGDYLTARPASGSGNTWVATTFTEQGACTSTTTSFCTNVEARFVSFGRQRDNPSAPTTTSLSPSSVATGGPAFTLTVTGTNFVSGAVVLWNGNPRATTFVSSTQLQATIPATDSATPGTASITVRNPDTSVSTPALLFSITGPVPRPAPILRPGPSVLGSPVSAPSNRPGGVIPGVHPVIPSGR